MKKQRIIRMNPTQFVGMIREYFINKGLTEGLEKLECSTFVSLDGQQIVFYATHSGLEFFATENHTHIAKSDTSFYEIINSIVYCDNCGDVGEFVVDQDMPTCPKCGGDVETYIDPDFMRLYFKDYKTDFED